MGKLFLESLEIQNFRGFRHLQIEKLGRVNLIVGKNNIGKSSLLEALELYARPGYPELIGRFSRSRNELRGGQSAENEVEEFLDALRYLFYGMEEIKGDSLPVRIGPVGKPDETLVLSLAWYLSELEQPGGTFIQRQLQPEEILSVDNPTPRLNVAIGQQSTNYSLVAAFGSRFRASSLRNTGPRLPNKNCVSIGANGLNSESTVTLWENVTLTDLENEVIKALHLIAPGVKDLSFVGRAEGIRNPVPYVRIEDIDKPLPLGNLGNGMYRLLGIVLAIANAKDGILLIDEIENGIHYSVQSDLWKLIFRLARRLNVQVFATTHSWDSVEGLQQAAEAEHQEEGMLIRLALQGENDIKVTLFDERRMEVAVRERIEIR
ncbi:MAG TPA: AAA family ATPase [Ktedonobacteraceae bacterium]|nr:AAA family ATPase [Ktedonobacteraceae bacterium]